MISNPIFIFYQLLECTDSENVPMHFLENNKNICNETYSMNFYKVPNHEILIENKDIVKLKPDKTEYDKKVEFCKDPELQIQDPNLSTSFEKIKVKNNSNVTAFFPSNDCKEICKTFAWNIINQYDNSEQLLQNSIIHKNIRIESENMADFCFYMIMAEYIVLRNIFLVNEPELFLHKKIINQQLVLDFLDKFILEKPARLQEESATGNYIKINEKSKIDLLTSTTTNSYTLVNKILDIDLLTSDQLVCVKLDFCNKYGNFLEDDFESFLLGNHSCKCMKIECKLQKTIENQNLRNKKMSVEKTTKNEISKNLQKTYFANKNIKNKIDAEQSSVIDKCSKNYSNVLLKNKGNGNCTVERIVNDKIAIDKENLTCKNKIHSKKECDENSDTKKAKSWANLLIRSQIVEIPDFVYKNSEITVKDENLIEHNKNKNIEIHNKNEKCLEVKIKTSENVPELGLDKNEKCLEVKTETSENALELDQDKKQSFVNDTTVKNAAGIEVNTKSIRHNANNENKDEKKANNVPEKNDMTTRAEDAKPSTENIGDMSSAESLYALNAIEEEPANYNNSIQDDAVVTNENESTDKFVIEVNDISDTVNIIDEGTDKLVIEVNDISDTVNIIDENTDKVYLDVNNNKADKSLFDNKEQFKPNVKIDKHKEKDVHNNTLTGNTKGIKEFTINTSDLNNNSLQTLDVDKENLIFTDLNNNLGTFDMNKNSFTFTNFSDYDSENNELYNKPVFETINKHFIDTKNQEMNEDKTSRNELLEDYNNMHKPECECCFFVFGKTHKMFDAEITDKNGEEIVEHETGDNMARNTELVNDDKHSLCIEKQDLNKLDATSKYLDDCNLNENAINYNNVRSEKIDKDVAAEENDNTITVIGEDLGSDVNKKKLSEISTESRNLISSDVNKKCKSKFSTNNTNQEQQDDSNRNPNNHSNIIVNMSTYDDCNNKVDEFDIQTVCVNESTEGNNSLYNMLSDNKNLHKVLIDIEDCNNANLSNPNNNTMNVISIGNVDGVITKQMSIEGEELYETSSNYVSNTESIIVNENNTGNLDDLSVNVSTKPVSDTNIKDHLAIISTEGNMKTEIKDHVYKCDNDHEDNVDKGADSIDKCDDDKSDDNNFRCNTNEGNDNKCNINEDNDNRCNTNEDNDNRCNINESITISAEYGSRIDSVNEVEPEIYKVELDSYKPGNALFGRDEYVKSNDKAGSTDGQETGTSKSASIDSLEDDLTRLSVEKDKSKSLDSGTDQNRHSINSSNNSGSLEEGRTSSDDNLDSKNNTDNSWSYNGDAENNSFSSNSSSSSFITTNTNKQNFSVRSKSKSESDVIDVYDFDGLIGNHTHLSQDNVNHKHRSAWTQPIYLSISDESILDDYTSTSSSSDENLKQNNDTFNSDYDTVNINNQESVSQPLSIVQEDECDRNEVILNDNLCHEGNETDNNSETEDNSTDNVVDNTNTQIYTMTDDNKEIAVPRKIVKTDGEYVELSVNGTRVQSKKPNTYATERSKIKGLRIKKAKTSSHLKNKTKTNKSSQQVNNKKITTETVKSVPYIHYFSENYKPVIPAFKGTKSRTTSNSNDDSNEHDTNLHLSPNKQLIRLSAKIKQRRIYAPSRLSQSHDSNLNKKDLSYPYKISDRLNELAKPKVYASSESIVNVHHKPQQTHDHYKSYSSSVNSVPDEEKTSTRLKKRIAELSRPKNHKELAQKVLEKINKNL